MPILRDNFQEMLLQGTKHKQEKETTRKLSSLNSSSSSAQVTENEAIQEQIDYLTLIEESLGDLDNGERPPPASRFIRPSASSIMYHCILHVIIELFSREVLFIYY